LKTAPEPQAKAPAAAQPEPRTQPAAVAEGRGARLDPDSARRIAAASKAAGHPVPAHVAAALKGAAETEN
jgi:hypothetical protein